VVSSDSSTKTLGSPPFSHVCYMSYPSNPPWHDNFNNVWWRLRFEVPQYAVCSNLLLFHLSWLPIFSTFCSLCPFLNARSQVSHRYKTWGKIAFSIFWPSCIREQWRITSSDLS
jgi:hypothetical protein